MSLPLDRVRVALLATDGVEELELTAARATLQQAGAEVHVIAPADAPLQMMHGLEPGERLTPDRRVSEARAAQYDGLVVPGGIRSADALRADGACVAMVRELIAVDKPVALSGHAPWLLVEANVARGRTLTSAPSIQTDLRNAGAKWVDQPIVVEQRLLTGRSAEELRPFCARLLDLLAASRSARVVDEALEETFPASDAPAWTPTSIGASKRNPPSGSSAPPPRAD